MNTRDWIFVSALLFAFVSIPIFYFFEDSRKADAYMKRLQMRRIERLTPGIYGTYGYECETGTAKGSDKDMYKIILDLDRLADRTM